MPDAQEPQYAHNINDVTEASYVLIAAYRRQQAFLAAPEPAPEFWWLEMQRAEQRAHGFPYKASDWFGLQLPENIRQRCRRAIDRLEKDGLLITWAKYGVRITHVKLTPAGAKLAVELLAKHGGVDVEARDPTSAPQAAAG